MRRNLKVVEDASRTELGAVRTVCGCRECTINCEYIPGYLIPADLDRLAAHFGEPVEVMAVRHLAASPGAVVLVKGMKVRVPTLVPRSRDAGGCKFLTDLDSGGSAKYCAIHKNAPYGCAFFDAHMGPLEVRTRSGKGLVEIMEDWAKTGIYARIWKALVALDLRAPAPEEQRIKMSTAWRKETGDE